MAKRETAFRRGLRRFAGRIPEAERRKIVALHQLGMVKEAEGHARRISGARYAIYSGRGLVQEIHKLAGLEY